MVDDNQERGSVAETSYPSEENITNLIPSVSTSRKITSELQPKKKARGTQIQRSSTNFFPQDNIKYREKLMWDKGAIILRMSLFLTNSVCIIVFNVQYTATVYLKPLFLLAIGGMDTKYPTLQKVNFKCYWSPIITEKFFKLQWYNSRFYNG